MEFSQMRITNRVPEETLSVSLMENQNALIIYHSEPYHMSHTIELTISEARDFLKKLRFSLNEYDHRRGEDGDEEYEEE
jgi:hypothetical protein